MNRILDRRDDCSLQSYPSETELAERFNTLIRAKCERIRHEMYSEIADVQSLDLRLTLKPLLHMVRPATYLEILNFLRNVSI